jgi:quercetin dioxygenase-like cupin family protein
MSPETAIAPKPYRLASGEGLADVWWMTGRVTVKAGPDETGNAFSQFEINDPRGTAPPLHVHHNEDEAFYVLDGEVTVLVGDERIDLRTGDYCFAPRGIRHTWIVRSERARMLVTVTPGGIEQLFVSLGVPVTGDEPPAAPVIPAPPELVRIFAGYGVDIVGPPPTLDDLS